MSKQHVGKTCVYCGKAPATTMDHVFARQFFPVERRANLPKAPACNTCNGAKSGLELYLTTVLPFGGRHEDGLVALREMVPPRLERNAKLKNALSAGHRQEWLNQNGVLTPAMTISFDSDRAAELFKYITQGLLYYHFGVVLDRQAHGVWAGFLNVNGEHFHRYILGLNSRARVKNNLGNGAFIYEGAQGDDIPQMSIWIFTVYGGIQTNGDPDDPEAISRFVGGVTASAGALRRFSAMLR